MPKQLTNPDVISGTVTDEEITSFTIDLVSNSVYIVFDRKDATGNIIIGDVSHLIQGAETVAAITRASQIAGGDVYSAIKMALYEYLPGNGIIS